MALPKQGKTERPCQKWHTASEYHQPNYNPESQWEVLALNVWMQAALNNASEPAHEVHNQRPTSGHGTSASSE